jgi:cytochrome c
MFLAGTLLALALYWSYQTLVNPEDQLDRHFYKILALVALFNLIYGISRQMYRHNALHKHQALVAAHTAHFQELSAEARKNPVSPQAALQIDTSLGEFALGAAIYQANCAACHKERERLVGPPVTEMVAIYANDPENLKKWIKAPGKKRPDYPQMPGFPQIPDDDLAELSKYILSIK